MVTAGQTMLFAKMRTRLSKEEPASQPVMSKH